MSEEIYISVDIETAGPIPGEYSMLSIGACAVENSEHSFYVELQPINDNADPAALAVCKLSMETLKEIGKDPTAAMLEFSGWINQIAGGRNPVFVGFNASFDWGFVNWYFHKFLGKNPFGIGALDIKAYYMGLSGCTWGETKSSKLPGEFQPSIPSAHNALGDARAQAEIFKKMLNSRQREGKENIQLIT
jgi:DNA polymerase III epsilon subunit-like protein